MADPYTLEILEQMGMAELREAGKLLDLTFGPSVSKADAREQILAAQPKQAVTEYLTDALDALAAAQTLTVEVTPPAATTGDRLPLVRRESTGEWKCPFPGCELRDSHESKQRRCHCNAAIIDGDEVVKNAQ